MSRSLIPSHFFRTTALLTALAISGCDSDKSDSEPNLNIGAANGTDFIALRVEAENFTTRTGGWTLTNHENIPTLTPDPDPPHHQSASGSANMELLPDTRATHDDVLVVGGNFWPNPGNGPSLEYELDIPAPGRYIVYVRAYSTGPEDNGIHVGFDQSTPVSGNRIQLCAGKNRWTWSSAQRVADNHCGVPKTIFLDIPTAGLHTVKFFAREDGFEIDQFLLLQETNDTLDCAPDGEDEVRCTNIDTGRTAGSYEIPAYSSTAGNSVNIPPPAPTVDIDLDIDIDTSGDNFTIGEIVNVSVQIDNEDNNDNATNVSASITLPDELEFNSSNSCVQQGNDVVCNFSEIAPEASATASFDVNVVQTGTPRLDAKVKADQLDSNLNNNSSSASINTTPYIPLLDGTLAAAQAPNITGSTENSQQILILRNAGRQDISNATIRFDGNQLLSIEPSPFLGDCSGSPINSCTLATIPAASELELPLSLKPLGSGLAMLQINFDVPGDEDQSNNTMALEILITDPPVYAMTQGDLAIEGEGFQNQIVPATSSTIDLHGWSVTETQLRSAITPDFDQGNFASASGESYIEYLPDSRLGTEDPAIDEVSNFAAGGTGAVLDYPVYFDNKGRYFINVRTRANNAEDATVHIGLNNTWPETAGLVSTCQPDGEWQWANGQIVNGVCDPTVRPYIDVDAAGPQVINLSAATDGIEVDKLILRLEDTNSPEGLGVEPSALEIVDLDIAVSSSFVVRDVSSDSQNKDLQSSEKQQSYIIEIENNDPENTAYDINVTISGIEPQFASEIIGFDNCVASEVDINCKVFALAAASSAVAQVDVGSTSDVEISASVTLSEASDTDPSNNSTVAKASSGGGTFSYGLLLFLVAVGMIPTRRRKASLRTLISDVFPRH